jgi:hypothetical protein
MCSWAVAGGPNLRVSLGIRSCGGDILKNPTILAVFGAALFGSGALADAKLTDSEAAKVKQAIAAWGCEGGKFEKESEGSDVLEAEDVICKGGQYDFRLDKNFNVIVITRD